jgi:transposase
VATVGKPFSWARFVSHQDLPTVLRCHIGAFAHLGGAPGHIRYDRMKTVVLRELEREAIQPRRAALAVRLTALSSA